MHDNDIQMIQTLASRLNIKKGTETVELKRFKDQIAMQSKIIKDNRLHCEPAKFGKLDDKCNYSMVSIAQTVSKQFQ